MSTFGNGFGGIKVAAGAATQSLTTTAGQMVAWAAAGGSNSDMDSNTADGNVDVVPDKANSRLKVNTPGVYLVMFELSGQLDTAGIVLARIRKNGVAIPGLTARVQCLTSMSQLVLVGIMRIEKTDLAVPPTLGTFADPATTGFAGAGAAPKTECPIDVTLEMASGAQILTINEATLTAIRLR